jgi:hypothetical protein
MNEESFIGYVEDKFYEFIKGAEGRNVRKFSIYQPALMNKVWLSKATDRGNVPIVERGFGLSLLKYLTEKPNYYHFEGIRNAPCNLVVGIQKLVFTPTRVPVNHNLDSVYKDVCAVLPPSEGIIALTTGTNFVNDSPLFVVKTDFDTVKDCTFDLRREILDEEILKAAAELQDAPLEEAVSKILILYSTTWDFVIQ